MLDHTFYRDTYPDLAEMSDEELAAHWEARGRAEDRVDSREALVARLGENGHLLPAGFDWRSYVVFNRTLAKSIADGVAAAEHYVAEGHAAKLPTELHDFLGRKKLSLDDVPDDFNWQAYLALNSDVRTAGYSTRDGAVAHFLQYGVGREWRRYRFDAPFYADYYLRSEASADGQREVDHWLDSGKAAGWHATIADWLKSLGMGSEAASIVPEFDEVKRLNGLESFGYRDLEEILTGRELTNLRIFENGDHNARFWRILANFAAMSGDDELSEIFARRSLEDVETSDAYVQLGDAAVRQGRRRTAVRNYDRAIELGSHSVWPPSHNARLKAELGDIDGAIADAQLLVDYHDGSAPAESAVRELTAQIWAKAQPVAQGLAAQGRRREMVGTVANAVREQARLRTEMITDGPARATKSTIRRDRVLLVADVGLPQTKRYRVDQKVEQLERQGLEVTVKPWNEAEDARRLELPWHDIVIVYRAPAWPEVVRLIADAKAAGKVVFYEIDDMLFDLEFPPPIEEYAGQVSEAQYQNLMTGMAAYRAAAQLCDYAIASTQPLVDKLGQLVTTGKAYLHRNGLDSHNPKSTARPLADEGAMTTIFYGSGTKAHNDDFIDLVLPGVERLLDENPQVRLMVVGHLVLPDTFVRTHRSQLVQMPLTRDIDEYMQLLSEADINLAVLHPGPLTDGKSELKWFEAANFGIPSVVSDTANYLDVIRDGDDAIIARTPDEWHDAVRRLIDDPAERQRMGEAARQRILTDYSLDALGESLVAALNAAADDRDRRMTTEGAA